MSAWTSSPPQELPAWGRLGRLAEARAWADRSAHGTDRFAAFSARLGPLLIDYSKQCIDEAVMGALAELAEQSGIGAAIADLCAGAAVNNTEQRPARHMHLRSPDADHAESERLLAFAESVRGGPWRTVLHIGIGGSHLGPELACQALAADAAPEVRFLANIDGHAVESALRGADPETTLAIVASKSFSTAETRSNAESVYGWFLKHLGSPERAARHFAAATANTEAAAAFGIPEARCFALDDAIGGRYSLWSSVGLPVAIALGRDGFRQLLAGAHQVDEHFRSAPPERNLPLLLALLQIWNGNFLGAATHAVLPYDHRLRLLPSYLQQLEMESNGKCVRRDGTPVAVHTAPVIWGGEETNGQHAFHQLLHQGTRAFSADFIACIRPDHARADHHRALLANCLAQSQALLHGRALQDLPDDALAAHRQSPGGRPSTTILLDALTPAALGALLALYEHKVFCAGVIWQINPFDQWGVELGKELAEPIREQLAGSASPDPEQDSSTVGLIAAIADAG